MTEPKSISLQRKLYTLIILGALLPTIVILVWGIAKSAQSAEFHPSALFSAM